MNNKQGRSVEESKSRPNSCSYSNRTCSQEPVEGYEFCERHILCNPSAPYVQCSYIYTQTGRRCQSVALTSDKKDATSLCCAQHNRKNYKEKKKASRKRKPPETIGNLFSSLQHYTTNKQGWSVIDKDLVKETEATQCASDSDDDIPANPTLDATWRGDGDSDPESIDSDLEDPLKHAGVYTAEEVATITHDKLVKLQSLYIQQYKRLQHLLKENKRKYTVAVRQEREVLPSIADAPKDTQEEKRAYEELKALLRYHKVHGKQSLLRRNKVLKREKANDSNSYRSGLTPKCIYTEGGVRCSERTVPLAKYCFKHILHDTSQVLYRSCGWSNGESTCSEPTLRLHDDTRCVIHTSLPPATATTQTKEES